MSSRTRIQGFAYTGRELSVRHAARARSLGESGMVTPSCILQRMSWPKPVETLWRDLENVRAEVLREVEGLSQRQAEWRPTPRDWSVGEVIDHLTIAEIATGKLTTKLTQETAPAVFPDGLPETVLVIRGADVVTADALLREADVIELRPVMSGGAS